jgi:hypothetical protein
MNNKKRLWSWQWKGGGFNSCFSSSKEDALQQAKDIGLPRPHSTVNTYLIPDERTLTDDVEAYHLLCDKHNYD